VLAIKGKALRSMAAPGTAYDDPSIGKDPQPADMDHYVKTTEDNGGVHINSGIPNRAFYLVATTIGGNAWEDAGHIWYQTLMQLQPTAQFADVATTTLQVAGELGPTRRQAVVDAWEQVGVEPASVMRPVKGKRKPSTRRPGTPAADGLDEILATFTRQIKEYMENR
jgi:Zn-dependent metalloprotease